MLFGEADNDYLDGRDGNDILLGGKGNDILLGGLGEDYLDGGVGTNILHGDEGDDILASGGGSGVLNGGTGRDTYLISRGSGTVIVVDKLNEGNVLRFGEGVKQSDVILRLGSLLLDLGNGDEVHIENFDKNNVYGSVAISSFEFADGSTMTSSDLLARGFYLNGTELNDSMVGTNITDRMYGLDGDDLMFGRGGSDVLMGGAGQDILVGDDGEAALASEFHGDDILDGGAGNDTLVGGGGNDTLFGSTGDDLLHGDANYVDLARQWHGDDRLDGGDGDDQVWGYFGNDALAGGVGADTLRGGEGDDVLTGGAGDDILQGEGGSDIYVFNLGDGQDSISEGDYSATTTDMLRFGAGIAASDIAVSFSNSVLTLGIAGTSDQVKISNWNWSWTWWDAPQNNFIDRVQFADGSIWDVATLQQKVDAVPIVGSAADDNLYGNQGDNLLVGGTGNDFLQGGSGNDTYRFNRGDGQDTIYEWEAANGFDTLRFGAGISAGDITFARKGTTLKLGIAGTSDSVNVYVWAGPSGSAQRGIDSVAFADGTVWDRNQIKALSATAPIVGSAGDDILYGNEFDDTFDSGSGDDTLYGYAGNDTYLINLGGGNDRIVEAGFYNYSDVKDSLRFGTGISAGNIVFGRSGKDLILGIGGTSDQVTLANWDQNYTYQIEEVMFADGTNWNAAYLQAGFDAVPYIGTAGDDTLSGNAGNNTLDGKAGNDSLAGGLGNDTYLFDLGGGQDTIYEWDGYATGGVDTLQFGAGIAPADIAFSRSGSHLILSVQGTSDRVTLLYWAGHDGYRVEKVIFANGTIWDSAFLQAKADVLPIIGTDGDDSLGRGTGINTMLGGLGNDIYFVDSAGDVVVENANEGVDEIWSSISYTLGVNLENLTLLGTGAINGTGNALDNVLTDGEGDNVVDGGLGADTMTGSWGNDTYVVDNVGDVVNENFDGSVDTVLSSITYALGAEIENLTLTGVSAVNGTGNSLDNTLTGNSAVNVLTGGTGNDLFVVGTGDTTIEAVNAGIDTVQSALAWTLAANVENLTLTGTSAINGTGNSLNNVLTGNSAANILSGAAGNDQYRFNLGGNADRVIETTGNDRIVFGAGVTSAQITATRTGSVVKLIVNGTDSISIDELGSGVFSVEQFEFEGGSVLDAAWLNALIPNAAPTATNLSAAETYTEDTTKNLVDIVVTDVDSANVTVTLTLSNIAAGSLNGGASGTVTSIYAAATGVWMASGAKANVNTLLAALTFTPAANFNGNFSIATSVSDGVAPAITGSKAFTGTAVNDAPTGTVTIAGTTTQGQTLTAANTLADVDGLGIIAYQWKAAGVSISGATASTFLLTAAEVGKAITVSASYTDGKGTAESKASAATVTVLAGPITGTAAADTINGTTGADQMAGLAGNDTYLANNAGDVVIENLNEGTDLVNASVSYTLGANVENITLIGTTTINATGNGLDNTLTGNSGINVLTGGAGNDLYVVGTGDTTIEALNAGTDMVQSAIAWTLATNVENLTLTGSSAVNGTGNSLDNTLTGNSGINVLTGGAGNDLYIVGTGDTTIEAVNAGTDTVRSAIAWTLAANAENLTLTGSAAVNGTGNTLDNMLNGNSGINTLTGNAGNDSLNGGAGADILVGGTGHDSYWLGRGYGIDSITENDATAGNTDVGRFEAGIATDQLWFAKSGNHLDVSIIGTNDRFTISNWYLGNQYRVEQFKTSDGKTLLDSQVQNLVQAMAAFSPPAAGQTTLSAAYQTSLAPVIAANWQ